jgi:hypothetical protein
MSEGPWYDIGNRFTHVDDAKALARKRMRKYPHMESRVFHSRNRVDRSTGRVWGVKTRKVAERYEVGW